MKEEQNEGIYVSIDEFAKALNLKVHYDGERSEIRLCTTNVNRPGLLLAGFNKYFGENRVQVMGSAEIKFLQTLDRPAKRQALERLCRYPVPCIIISRSLHPTREITQMAKKYKRPVFLSDEVTSTLDNELVMYLNDLLAPTTTSHGVLLDVYGVGVLITGKSGIGKSETALELIKRGHRLIADDAVIVKNIKNTILGTAPAGIRYFMEIRGIGIIDIRNMYGVGSVAKEQEIELVIELELWDEQKNYERLGLGQLYYEILGKKIPSILLPVRPGRNLAIVVESAAMNHRLKERGFNAAEELNNRLMNKIYD
ncbi:MAG: HPr(Ser) kinase/phosphatase [Christensenellales bacterium]